MITINLPAKIAKSVASLNAVAASPKSYAPLFQTVRVEIASNEVTAMATDKYSLAVASYFLDTDTPDAVFYLDTLAVKFISGIKLPSRGFAGIVKIEIEDDRLTVSYDSLSQSFPYKSFEYPAQHLTGMVANWQMGTEPLPFGVDPNRFASFAKILDEDGNKIARWVMSFGQPKDGNKPAPLRLVSGNITLLTQPAITN